MDFAKSWSKIFQTDNPSETVVTMIYRWTNFKHQSVS